MKSAWHILRDLQTLTYNTFNDEKKNKNSNSGFCPPCFQAGLLWGKNIYLFSVTLVCWTKLLERMLLSTPPQASGPTKPHEDGTYLRCWTISARWLKAQTSGGRVGQRD